MTGPDATAELATVLRLENAALECNDFAASGMLLGRKQAAVQVFADAWRAPGAARAVLPQHARELALLVDANRRLLDQAMGVQKQVIGTVARAASGAGSSGGRYGRSGAAVRMGAGTALHSRA